MENTSDLVFAKIGGHPVKMNRLEACQKNLVFNEILKDGVLSAFGTTLNESVMNGEDCYKARATDEFWEFEEKYRKQLKKNSWWWYKPKGTLKWYIVYFIN